MRLATVRTAEGTRAVRIDDDAAVELGHPDLGALLARPGWPAEAAAATGPAHPLDGLDYAPVVPHPEKILCVGLNYRTHILEMGRELPEYPTLFAKFSRSLIGAYDPITLPAGSVQVDWEAELGVVVGAEVRHASQAQAAIAGYTVVNDITARDVQCDLIATGTPGGVGHARTPPRYLTAGSSLVTTIERVGECRNVCVAP